MVKIHETIIKWAGNVFGVAAFLLVCSFIRIKCPSCGAFLPVKAQ